jgi:hypothetical protein
MFNNVPHIRADDSTFIHVGGDQYNISAMTTTDEASQLASWISPLNFNEQQDAAYGKCTKGTGAWFLHSPEFKRWIDTKSGVLWCPGNR